MDGSRICNGICSDLKWIPSELFNGSCKTGIWPEAAVYLIDVCVTNTAIKKKIKNAVGVLIKR